MTYDLTNMLRSAVRDTVYDVVLELDEPMFRHLVERGLTINIPKSKEDVDSDAQAYDVPNTHQVPFIRQVIFDEASKTTVVLWFDDDKTVVRCGEGETFDRYTGFMAAICKKMFGGTTTAKKLMNELDKGYQAKLKAEAEAKEKEKRMAEEEERAKKAAKRREQAYHDRLAEMVEYYLMKRDAKEIANEIMKEQEAEENKNASEE